MEWISLEAYMCPGRDKTKREREGERDEILVTVITYPSNAASPPPNERKRERERDSKSLIGIPHHSDAASRTTQRCVQRAT
jgi:hypothetical protein